MPSISQWDQMILRNRISISPSQFQNLSKSSLKWKLKNSFEKIEITFSQKKYFAPLCLPLTFKHFFLQIKMLPQKIFTHIVLTFDVKLHSISVFPMGILNTQKIPSRVGWAHFLYHKSGNVAIFPLGVLDHLFSEVATVQVLGDYTNDSKFT